MKTISLTCNHCGAKFDKLLKEHKRRVKSGHTKFFCSRTCTGMNNIANLPDPSNPRNMEHLKAITPLAIAANRKYSEEDFKFQEYIRRTSARKQHSNDLTIDYLKEVWHRQDGKCAISNIPLQHATETNNKNFMASIDRIDSNLGYVRGNIQFLTCALNLAKNNGSDDHLRELIALIIEHQTQYSE